MKFWLAFTNLSRKGLTAFPDFSTKTRIANGPASSYSFVSLAISP